MPTRYLKPGIRDSEAIDQLTSAAEVLFYRLLVTVDDFGRTDARPAMIKAACFPVKRAVDDQACAKLLGELVAKGLILHYVVDGKPYLQMQKWDNLPRAAASKYPAPVGGCAKVHTDARNPRTDAPVTETETGTGTETGTETGTGGKAPRKRSASPSAPEKPGQVTAQTWADWLELRKKKRAPVTQTVIDGAIEEAAKAGLPLEDFLRIWCRRGSQGLDASWLTAWERQQTGPTPSKQQALEAANAQVAAKVLAEMTAGGGNG